MILYLAAETNIPDVVVDFIDVQLQSGEQVSLNWDESSIFRSKDSFEAKYKGVYFDEEYANGRISDLQGMQITNIGLYFEADGEHTFQISEMLFEDNENTLTITSPEIPANCSGMDGICTESPEIPEVSMPKIELDVAHDALDIMGDRTTGREGYSPGEANRGLKENHSSVDTHLGKHKPLTSIISDAESKLHNEAHSSDFEHNKDLQR